MGYQKSNYLHMMFSIHILLQIFGCRFTHWYFLYFKFSIHI